MNITLKKEWCGFLPGATVSVSSERAEYLDKNGYCDIDKPEKVEKPEKAVKKTKKTEKPEKAVKND